MKKLIARPLVAALTLTVAACAPPVPAFPNGAFYSPPPAAPRSSDPLADDPRLAEYGQALFFARGFAFDEDRSCASCHRPERAFSGPNPVNTQAWGPRDVTSLLGASRRERWMMLGDVESLERACEHAFGDGEMFGGSLRLSLRHLSQSEPLTLAHSELFGRAPSVDGAEEIGVTLKEVGRALAAYLRQLEPGGSRFDHAAAAPGELLLAGDALRGFEIFHGRTGCSSCHSGPSFTDGEIRDLGMTPLDDIQIGLDPDDPLAQLEAGQYDANLSLVQTPSLRDAARTAPYMHDGRFATLTDVLRYYSEEAGKTPEARALGVPLEPLNLSERDIADLVAFLESLNSALPPVALRSAPSGD